MEDWIISRKMSGMKSVSGVSNMDIAKDIFNTWDTENKGFLTIDELTEHLMSLGLCTSRQFVDKLLSAISTSG